MFFDPVLARVVLQEVGFEGWHGWEISYRSWERVSSLFFVRQLGWFKAEEESGRLAEFLRT